MDELTNLFQNNHIQNSNGELQELLMNKEILDFLSKENIKNLSFIIEDKINIEKNISLNQFLHRLENKNKFYLNNIIFDISNKTELNIKNKIMEICKLKIENNYELYMTETHILLSTILSYLD